MGNGGGAREDEEEVKKHVLLMMRLLGIICQENTHTRTEMEMKRMSC